MELGHCMEGAGVAHAVMCHGRSAAAWGEKVWQHRTGAYADYIPPWLRTGRRIGLIAPRLPRRRLRPPLPLSRAVGATYLIDADKASAPDIFIQFGAAGWQAAFPRGSLHLMLGLSCPIEVFGEMGTKESGGWRARAHFWEQARLWLARDGFVHLDNLAWVLWRFGNGATPDSFFASELRLKQLSLWAVHQPTGDVAAPTDGWWRNLTAAVEAAVAARAAAARLPKDGAVEAMRYTDDFHGTLYGWQLVATPSTCQIPSYSARSRAGLLGTAPPVRRALPSCAGSW